MNKAELLNEGYTCLIYRDDELAFSSKDTGIKPLLYVINNNINVNGCEAYDKIVGKAAAMLYAHMGVSYVYAEVMSKDALAMLSSNNIKAEYATLTDRIINRRGDDICPMEKVVKDIDEPDIALVKLQSKVKELSKANNK